MKLSSLPLIGLVVTAPLTLIEPALKNSSSRSRSATAPKSATRPEKPQPCQTSNLGTWACFSSTFLTIFLAEMGDKTQLATLLMSAESQSPWIVFAGAAVALIATSLIGVLLGRWLATRLSPKTLETAAGALLLCISIMLLWDVVHF
ncbi:MAG: TMEM165/GDT1 family protein [Coleofasciculus sp. S288]|nr:TMEM165/GDT1 family protein [Coleofasciculus sp. S288]